MTEYEKRKEEARNKAACIELYLEIYAASPEELEEIHRDLYKMAKRAGLVQEFKGKGYL